MSLDPGIASVKYDNVLASKVQRYDKGRGAMLVSNGGLKGTWV